MPEVLVRQNHGDASQCAPCWWEQPSSASPVNLNLLPSMVYTLSNPHLFHSLVSLSSSTQPLRSQGKGRLLAPHCLGSRCISIHAHTHSHAHTHTHAYASAGTQVFAQQIKCIVALPPASRGWKVIQRFCSRTTWGFMPPGVFTLFWGGAFEKATHFIQFSVTHKDSCKRRLYVINVWKYFISLC